MAKYHGVNTSIEQQMLAIWAEQERQQKQATLKAEIQRLAHEQMERDRKAAFQSKMQRGKLKQATLKAQAELEREGRMVRLVSLPTKKDIEMARAAMQRINARSMKHRRVA